MAVDMDRVRQLERNGVFGWLAFASQRYVNYPDLENALVAHFQGPNGATFDDADYIVDLWNDSLRAAKRIMARRGNTDEDSYTAPLFDQCLGRFSYTVVAKLINPLTGQRRSTPIEITSETAMGKIDILAAAESTLDSLTKEGTTLSAAAGDDGRWELAEPLRITQAARCAG